MLTTLLAGGRTVRFAAALAATLALGACANNNQNADASGFGADASFALVVDPLRLLALRSGKSAPPDPAPVVVAIGKTPEPSAMWARVDVAATVVQELIKHRGAF